MQAPWILKDRFRGFMPVAVDVETGGIEPETHALLEISAVLFSVCDDGQLAPSEHVWLHVLPFEGAAIDEEALRINKIKPEHPLRPAVPEREALRRVFRVVRRELKATGCSRAILVGHNAHFDLAVLNAAIKRSGIKRNPFHRFSVFDTCTLGGAMFGQTVMSLAVQAAGLKWNEERAHSALYDAQICAQLFCEAVNRINDQSNPALSRTRA